MEIGDQDLGEKTLVRVLCRQPTGLDRRSQLRFVAGGNVSAHDNNHIDNTVLPNLCQINRKTI